MSRGTVFVVDDNELVLSITGQVLEDAGYRVVPLTSAFALNGAIRGEIPDLILLDVRMPALSGEKAAAILRQRRFSSEIPILLHSELPEDELEELARRSDASGWVRKRPMAAGLVEAVAAWVGAPGDDRSVRAPDHG